MVDYKIDERGQCPHCQTVVRFIKASRGAWGAEYGGVSEDLDVYVSECPECGRLIVTLEEVEHITQGSNIMIDQHAVWPLFTSRPPVPEIVDEHIAKDYNEAALVLNLSAKASAALSRRCLQTILVEKGGADENKNLYKQIGEVLDKLPAYIANNLDAVREIGNFAAHPRKSENTGEIMDVEPGEAEWNLEVLDSLFDHYYVKPETEKGKREALNIKLAEAGKSSIREVVEEREDAEETG